MIAPKPPDAQIVVTRSDGNRQPIAKTVRELIILADKHAQTTHSPAVDGIDATLRSVLVQAGVEVNALQLHRAVQQLDRMRKTARYETVEIQLGQPPGAPSPAASNLKPTEPEGVFEPERRFPDAEALALYDRLAGIDEQKTVLTDELLLSTNPAHVEAWSRKHHKRDSSTLLAAYRQRVPLIILQGDVGTGKTALAESIGAALVRDRVYADVRLLKLTGQVRGQGLVGQMSDEIVKAFAYAEARSAALGPSTPLLLLIDEADAIATSRAGEQMHHEDKAGVNTLLQRLDRLKTLQVRPVVIFITNRIGAIDPALARRAGAILRFNRPTQKAREAIFGSMLREYGFSPADISRLAKESERSDLAFTASDLADKIVIRALQHAVREQRALTMPDVLAAMQVVQPSPAFVG